jgi:hypothetical protein
VASPTPAQGFRFRYGVVRPLLSILALGPRFSSVELDDETLRVRMGWAFRATIPRRQIVDARARRGLVGGIGVHGWNGRWLVNGAATGLVAITVDPPVRAWVVAPVKLKELTISLEDPGALLAALGR